MEETDNIEIEEDVVIGDNEIKVEEFTLNTSTSGSASYVTGLINGFLEGIIISSSAPVQISISLDEYNNIVLYNVLNFYGEKYEIIRAEAVKGDVSREKFNYSQEKFALNDRLKKEIKGPFGTQVKFCVRYS